jgi:hypothetical protein
LTPFLRSVKNHHGRGASPHFLSGKRKIFWVIQMKLANSTLSPCVRYCSRTDLDMPSWSMARRSQRSSRFWKMTFTSATTHSSRKWIDGLLPIPHRLAENAKSIENNSSFYENTIQNPSGCGKRRRVDGHSANGNSSLLDGL